MKRYLGVGAGAVLVLALLLALTIELESVPPLWWDEGWTLTVARNWVDRGHYGRLLAGQLAPSGLEAAFSVTAPIALSFRLLGVGIWQGRLVGAFFTLGALGVMCYLAGRLYGRSAAISVLAILLLVSPIHPVVMGRQVLGEVPALFYLLAGYACFLSAWHRPLQLMLPTMSLWGVALITKAQVLPFLTLSLLLPLSIMLFQRNWRAAGLLAVGLLGSLIASRLLFRLQELLLQGHTLPITSVHGLYEVVAIVPVTHVRVFALIVTFMFGAPTILGLCYAAWNFHGNRDKAAL